MRCPICDYDPELGFENQSMFFKGLSLDVNPTPYTNKDGEVECNCLEEELDEQELEDFGDE